MKFHLRIAKPVSNLARTLDMYCRGLGLQVITHFQNHEGFDGVILGSEHTDCHFEFTHCRDIHVVPAPTVEDLLVFYYETQSDWEETCANLLAAGFERIDSFNPYWDVRGRTYIDPDGYRIVIQLEEWDNFVPSSAGHPKGI